MSDVKTRMTDEERVKLAAKLDAELEEYVGSLEKRKYTEGWPEDNWEQEMEKHPFFMTKCPAPGEPLSPLMEGLQKLKYDPDENTPLELANSYKEDGNFNFKHKNYRLAIMGYTEAIQVKCGDLEMEASLYNNRAASHFFLKNYRSSLRDCEIAIKKIPKYTKAITRAANCCLELRYYDRCIQYCDNLLFDDGDNKNLITLRNQAVQAKKIADKEARRKLRDAIKSKQDVDLLLGEFRKRGIQFEKTDTKKAECLNLLQLDPIIPELSQHRVALVGDSLVWPVLFLYPEYQTRDVVQQFNENTSIKYHLAEMFTEPPEWDLEHKYCLENINVYFENRLQGRFCSADTEKSLKDILCDERYLIRAYTPTFFVIVAGSVAEKNFLAVTI